MLDKEPLIEAPRSTLRLSLYSQLWWAYLGVDLDEATEEVGMEEGRAVDVGSGGY